MRIVREGRLPFPTIYEGTCENCKCQVECEDGDKVMEVDQGERNYSKIKRSVKCPTNGCDERIQLTEKKKQVFLGKV